MTKATAPPVPAAAVPDVWRARCRPLDSAGQDRYQQALGTWPTPTGIHPTNIMIVATPAGPVWLWPPEAAVADQVAAAVATLAADGLMLDIGSVRAFAGDLTATVSQDVAA